MPTETILIGPAILLVEDQIYALPPRACYIFAQGTAPEISNDGVSFSALPSNDVVAAQFIRSTGTDSIVSLKTP